MRTRIITTIKYTCNRCNKEINKCDECKKELYETDIIECNLKSHTHVLRECNKKVN